MGAIRDHSGIKGCQKRFLVEMRSLLSATKALENEIPISPLEHSLTTLADEMKFDECDKTIFSLVARYKIHDALERLFDDLGKTGGTPLQTISLLTGLDKKVVTERLSITS